MPEVRLDPNHVGILMRSHAKYAVRGGSGITFVLLVVMVGLTVAGFLMDPLDEFRKWFERQHGHAPPREQFVENVFKNASPAISWWVSSRELGPELQEEDPHVDFLLKDRPALLSIMFLVLLALTPFMMAFGGFNQLSGDIANRGLRYLLLRTSRLNIVIARLLGTFLFSAATSLFTVTVIVAYLALRYQIYPVGDLVTWGLRGWAALNIFGLPYLALCTWISTAVGSPFAALALAQMAIGVPIVLVKYAKTLAGDRVDLAWLERVTPWGWKFDLLHPDFGKVALAVAVMLGFFALFAFLGARHFLKRDL